LRAVETGGRMVLVGTGAAGEDVLPTDLPLPANEMI
jgi:hypothetical protein